MFPPVQRTLESIASKRSGQTAKQFSKDFFIDAGTYHVSVIQDFVAPSTSRRIRYSDYKEESGMLVPYTIAEEAAGKPTRTIRLDSLTINPGLRKEDFKLTAR